MNFAAKEDFRNFCKKRLFGSKSHLKIDETLEAILKASGARRILLYLPMKHEPDIGLLLKRLRKRYEIFVPFMEGESFKMVKFRLPLQKRRFGIKEPKNSFFSRDIDLAVVPVLGVDGDFRRVGFGQGMYDRFFERLRKKPPILFVQKRLCLTDKILTQQHDIRGDMLITPKEILIRGDSDVGRDIGRKFCSHFKRRCRIYPRKKDRKG